jgi:hypothetical protein
LDNLAEASIEIKAVREMGRIGLTKLKAIILKFLGNGEFIDEISL